MHGGRFLHESPAPPHLIELAWSPWRSRNIESGVFPMDGESRTKDADAIGTAEQ